jgi:streptogrisin C
VRFGAGAWFALLVVAFAPAARTEPPILNLPAPAVAAGPLDADAALRQDAESYARHYGVVPDQAVAELRALSDDGPLLDRITAEQGERLAGIVVEHRPALRLVFSLTGDEPVADEAVPLDGLLVPVSYRTGAGATRAAVLDAIRRHQADLRAALLDAPGLGVDARTGALLVLAGAADANGSADQLAGQLEAIAGVPVEVAPSGYGADLSLEGGGRLEHADPAARRRFTCTGGFVVTDGVRSAIATAAHCPDELDAVASDGTRTPLAYLGAWGAGAQDVQLNGSPTPLPPAIHAGSDPAATRWVTGARPRAHLLTGDWVCHQGERSGYSCAEVALADYAPPGDLCAGPCPPDWVAVAGPACAHGDSGGPVFLGGQAIGLVKGGSYRPDGGCNHYYFMSVDYLPAGWSLATTGAEDAGLTR